MADIVYKVILQDAGVKAFTMPDGFYEDVEIHCWGAGGGKGRGGAFGGGGGYAKTTVNINEGDEVSLQIGQPGTNGGYPAGGRGGLDSTYRLFRGGNSADAYDEDADTGAGGGGGGASWVAVNDSYVCVGAGGGGAGGYGDDSSGGFAGLPGGVTTNGLSGDTRGGDAPLGWSTGGGGGAGYPKGGKAGLSYGDDAGNPPAGSGGQNYGNVTVAGSGTLPGGTTVSYYPGSRRGEANYPGYIAIILRKKLNVSIKNAKGDGTWANVASAYVKLPATTVTTSLGTVTTMTAGWKQIQAAWTKVNDAWKPILTDKGITLYDYPIKRKKANITISVNTSDYNLYNNIPIDYFEGLMDIDVWVFANVVITGNSSSTAFTVSNFTSGDNVILHNHGYLAGKGGLGGSGGYRYTSGKNTYSAPATAGAAGGTALLITYPITLLNDGNIAGGGGGGGGSSVQSTGSSKSPSFTNGSQGGGGAGFGSGANNGSLTAGGAGAGTAGAGGSRGQSGVSSGAAGGAAGYAIQGASILITGSNVGSYFGPLAT